MYPVSYITSYIPLISTVLAMSTTGPPADAKQAQAAALAELEAAQRKKRAIDTTLVRVCVRRRVVGLGRHLP